MTNQDLAKEYREEHQGRYPGGVVVIFDHHVSGWMSELRDPHKWEPGCIAVDQYGNEWLAVGGDPYNGAKSWQPIERTTQEAS